MKKWLKCIAMSFLLVSVALSASAQTFEDYQRKIQEEYSAYSTKIDREYLNYLAKINAEYASYMRREWPEYQGLPALPLPQEPLPPTVLPDYPDIQGDPVQSPEMPEIPVDIPDAPVPDVDVPEDKLPEDPLPEIPTMPSAGNPLYFSYYGTECCVHMPENGRLSLDSCSEDAVADLWESLSTDRWWSVVKECKAFKRSLDLCDWAYFLFTNKLTEAYCGDDNINEARVLQMFIMTQSGYKLRLARSDGRIYLLMPSQDVIYGRMYFTLKDGRYYLAENCKSNSFNVLDREFPKENAFSLEIDSIPSLTSKDTAERVLTSERYPSVSVKVHVNENLMRFYDDYPYCRWNLYAQTSFTPEVKAEMYPVLRTAISGLSEKDAVEVLLNFVQTAFEYETDDRQFGYERPLFPDESLYYPFCDCEDRSIMFTAIVHDLLDLDIVMLSYPNHVASAVRFPEGGYGDCVKIGGKVYTICDPTYIRASVGMAMPDCKGIVPEVITCHFR